MNELNYVQALVLGVLQGLTEFLPISSSGHLALAQRWLELDPGGAPMLLFDLLAHVGTVLAVAVVFRRSFARFVARLSREWRDPRFRGRRHACRFLTLATGATIATAAVGLGYKNTFESAFDKPGWIGVGLLATGFLLTGTAFVGRGKRGWRAFRWWQAVMIGLAQGVAIFPGVSRSGITIGLALCCGLRRRWAAEFSFLIAVPAICGATVLKLSDTLGGTAGPPAELPWGPIAVGGSVSLLVGVVALHWLLNVIRRAKLHYFAAYCFALGLIVLATGA